jgi:hypothetical protein
MGDGCISRRRLCDAYLAYAIGENLDKTDTSIGSPLDLAFSPCIYAAERGCLKPQRYCGRFNLLCIPKDEPEEEEREEEAPR